ncbi:MAG: Crp/Fnr family transcriptional regulator [Sporomusaceae bacterium]|nr:Crp/Fnr family transcriptional regulator [Sporomusaceae bacterium]
MPITDCLLSSEEEHELISLGTKLGFRKGETIFAAGQRAAEIHYILSGWVSVYKVTNQGTQVSVGLRYRGEFAGLGSFACDGERGCSAQALIDSEVVILPRDNFRALLRKYPVLNDKFFCLLGARLRETQNNMVYFIANQTDKRLALTLINIGQYLGRPDGHRRQVNIRLPQEELAHIIGCSRQTVNNLLNEMRAAGSVEINGREIVAVNPAKLATFL